MSRKQNFRFYDHDDRGNSSNHNMRKVSFKNNYGRVHKTKKGDKAKDKFFSKLKLDDEDVDMTGCEISGYKITKRRNFVGRARSPGLQQYSLKPSDWYKVKIVYGSRFEKNILLQLLLKYIAPHVFTPISYEVIGMNAVFFVDDIKTADILRQANKKITLPNGNKMIIEVREGFLPLVPVDDDFKEKMKQVMSRRYIAENKALDLSKFYKDSEFYSSGLYFTLARPTVFKTVMQIISDNIPDLYALDLTDNKIRTIDVGTAAQFQKLKNLRILHLGENYIKKIGVLNVLKGLELTQLVLKDNPFVQSFPDHVLFLRYDSAVTEVRKRFPNLTSLDNVELPPVISFDVEDSKLPTPQASFICNPEGRSIVREFLSQYFALFDSNKRSELLQAYHDNAYFSQCSFYIPNPNSSGVNQGLGAYIQESRNLLKLHYPQKRRSRLHIGKNNVVKFLESFPDTQHDLSSFVVDLSIFTPTLINLSVSGVYREPNYSSASNANWPVRHFSRTFLIVPVGQGFCIINDSLFITNATEEEKEAFFKVDTQNAAILQSPSTSQITPTPAGPAAVPAAAAPVDETVRLQMVQTLAGQTGMNLEWSKKCLDETQWNFERAVWTFTELQKRGTIPPEAFVK